MPGKRQLHRWSRGFGRVRKSADNRQIVKPSGYASSQLVVPRLSHQMAPTGAAGVTKGSLSSSETWLPGQMFTGHT